MPEIDNNAAGYVNHRHHSGFRSTENSGALRRDRAYSKNSSANHMSSSVSMNVLVRENVMGRSKRPSEPRYPNIPAGDGTSRHILASQNTEQQGQRKPRKGNFKENQAGLMRQREFIAGYGHQLTEVSDGSPTRKFRKQGQHNGEPNRRYGTHYDNRSSRALVSEASDQSPAHFGAEKESVHQGPRSTSRVKDHIEGRKIQYNGDYDFEEPKLMISSVEAFPPLPSVSSPVETVGDVNFDSKDEPKAKKETLTQTLESDSSFPTIDSQHPFPVFVGVCQGSPSTSLSNDQGTCAQSAKTREGHAQDQPDTARASEEQAQNSLLQSPEQWDGDLTAQLLEDSQTFIKGAAEDSSLEVVNDSKSVSDTEIGPSQTDNLPEGDLNDTQTSTSLIEDRQTSDVHGISPKDPPSKVKINSGTSRGSNRGPEIPIRTSSLSASSPPKASPPIATHRKRQKGESRTKINFGSDSKINKKKSESTLRFEPEQRSYPSADENHAVEVFPPPSCSHENVPNRRSQSSHTYGGSPQPIKALVHSVKENQDQVDEPHKEPEKKKKPKKSKGKKNKSQDSTTAADKIAKIDSHTSSDVNNVNSQENSSSHGLDHLIYIVTGRETEEMKEKRKWDTVGRFLQEKGQQGWPINKSSPGKNLPQSRKVATRKNLEELHPELSGPRITEVEDDDISSSGEVQEHGYFTSNNPTTGRETLHGHSRSQIIDLEDDTVTSNPRRQPFRRFQAMPSQDSNAVHHHNLKRTPSNVSDCSTITSSSKIHLETPKSLEAGFESMGSETAPELRKTLRSTARSSQEKSSSYFDLPSGLGLASHPPSERNNSTVPETSTPTPRTFFGDRNLPPLVYKEGTSPEDSGGGKAYDELEFPPLKSSGGHTMSKASRKRKSHDKTRFASNSTIDPDQDNKYTEVSGTNVSGKLTVIAVTLTPFFVRYI